MKRKMALMLSLCMMIAGAGSAYMVKAATKLSVSTKKVSLVVGESKIVKANKKVNWKSSNKEIAIVKKTGKKKAKITAIKKGNCKITATNGKKNVVIKVNVEKKKNLSTVNPTLTPVVTVAPTIEPKQATTIQPLNTLTPSEQQELANAIPIISQSPVTSQEPVVVTQTAIPSMSQPPVTNGISKKITLNIRKCEQENQILELTIHNGTDANIEVGYAHFTLYRLEDNIWTKVEQMENVPSTIDLAFIVKPNEDWSEKMSLKEYYGELPLGQYRIVKTMYPDNIYVDFSIQNPV